MAIQTSATTPANGTAAIFTLITSLCTAGWTIPAWSDATTLTTPGSPLTSNPYGGSGSGANNLGNTSAWFRITAPDSSREWLFQRGSADQTWTVSRSRLGFTGGTPNATTIPTDATSGQNLLSAGQLFDSTLSSRWLISLESSSPYGWYAFTVLVAGGNVRTILFDEPLSSGSYPTEDTDPVVFAYYYNATGFAGAGGFVMTTSGTAAGYKRYRHGLSSPSIQRIPFLAVQAPAGSNQVAPATDTSFSQMGIDPYNSKEIPVPIFIARNGTASTSTGWVGITNRLRWSTQGGRSNGQTLIDSGNTLYWIFCAGVWVPWDSSTPTI